MNSGALEVPGWRAVLWAVKQAILWVLDRYLKYPSSGSNRSYMIFKVTNALVCSHVRTSCVIINNFCHYLQINDSAKNWHSVLPKKYFCMFTSVCICVCISCACSEIVVHLEWILTAVSFDYKPLSERELDFLSW